MNARTQSHTSSQSSSQQVREINGRRIFEVHNTSSSVNQKGKWSVLRVPETIGSRYRVTHFLSCGGQGAVFVAEDLTLHRRKVLIKMTRIKGKYLQYGLNESDWESFREQAQELQFEAKRLIEIRNRGESRAPCLLRLVRDVYADAIIHPKSAEHDLADQQCLYLVMQYLPGVTLKSMIQQVARGQHPTYQLHSVKWWRMSVLWVRQLSSILSSLHKFDHEGYGLIYCDLKPENCIVSHRDISLIDFGAIKDFDAQGSQRGGVMTTAGYCAPETQQDAYKGDLDGKVDVYSLGVVLWSMLSGQKPTDHLLFDNLSPDLLAVRGALPDDLPQCLREILKRTLERDRDQRISAKELKNLCREAIRSLAELSASN